MQDCCIILANLPQSPRLKHTCRIAAGFQVVVVWRPACQTDLAEGPPGKLLMKKHVSDCTRCLLMCLWRALAYCESWPCRGTVIWPGFHTRASPHLCLLPTILALVGLQENLVGPQISLILQSNQTLQVLLISLVLQFSKPHF